MQRGDELAALHAAFGGLAVPERDALTEGNAWARRDLPEAERLRAWLAGRHWQDITADEAQERWSSFVYLAPDAFRFYLPALLRHALEQFDEGKLLHSVVYALNPSYWRMYFEGSDPHFLANRAALDDAQYAFVEGFLFLAFRESQCRELAAAALRHGWNATPDSDASRAVRQWYARQTQWRCPPPEAEAEEIVRTIELAFADAQCPPLHELSASAQGNEPAELAIELQGLAWQQVAPAYLDRHSACLSFFTPAGLCHFLPAYLRAEAMGLLQSDGPLFTLAYVPSAEERFAPLTDEQRAAVRAWLHFVRERAEEWDSYTVQQVDSALQGYWRASAMH